MQTSTATAFPPAQLAADPASGPHTVHIDAFQVTGLSVRTRNSDENDPATARIGSLWDRFFSQSWERHLPAAGHDGRLFGVYSAYESDAHSAFDVTVGVATDPGANAGAGGDAGGEKIRITPVLAGTYLVFTGAGPMPQMVIDTWGAIWAYFARNPQVQRRFGTDFEAYSGPDQVAIHIGIVGDASCCMQQSAATTEPPVHSRQLMQK